MEYTDGAFLKSRGVGKAGYNRAAREIKRHEEGDSGFRGSSCGGRK